MRQIYLNVIKYECLVTELTAFLETVGLRNCTRVYSWEAEMEVEIRMNIFEEKKWMEAWNKTNQFSIN